MLETSQALPQQAEPKRTVILWMACLAHTVQDGLSAAVYVLLPVLAQSLGLNLSEVGLFKGLKSFAQGLLEIASGVASERFGDRALLVFGIALSGSAYLLFSLADSSTGVLLCLVLVGIGTAFQHAPASALISRTYASDGRRGALGLYNSSGDVGKLLFTTTFSLGIGAGLAWNVITFGYGLAAVFAAIVIFVALRSSMLAKASAYRQEARAAESSSQRVGTWGILDKRGFAALLAVVALDSMVQAGALTFAAFLMLEKGMPLYLATFAATAILIGGIFGKAICGYMADRIGARTAFALIQILTGLGLIAVVFSSSILAYALLPFLGVVLQGSTSITYGMVNDFIHPSRIARGFALVYGGSSFPLIIGPVSFGLIGDAYGVSSAILTMAAIAFAAILPCWWLRLEIRAATA